MLDAIKAEELLEIEETQVSSSVWIADTEEDALELTKRIFLRVTASNIAKGIEYRFIFSREDSTRRYWADLQAAIVAEKPESDVSGKLSARFVPKQIIDLIPDFVLYDAKKPSRRAFIGVVQNGEYWHIEQDQSRVLRLRTAYERLWDAGLHAHLLIADEESSLVCTISENLLPSDVSRIINENMQEASRCLATECPTAAIALYGRTIETLLHSAYVQVMGVEPDSAWGLDALSSRLREASMNLVGLREQFGLIKKFRNKAVHGSAVFPTQEQARAIGMLAKDLIAQISRQLKSVEDR